MIRIAITSVAASAALWIAPEHTVTGRSVVAAAPFDIAALMAETRGAPRMICALAANSIGNGGWWGGMGAPAAPLAPTNARDAWRNGRIALTGSERTLLLESVTSPDDCTREMAVRLLGRDSNRETLAGLSRHAASAPSWP